MAAVNINIGPTIRHEAVGAISLNDGTDDITIKNIVPGTLRMQPGMYDVIQTYDQSVPQQALVGNRKPSTITFSVFVGNDHTSAGLLGKLQAVRTSSTNDLWKEFTNCVVTWKDSDATGTALPWSCTKVRVASVGPVQAGANAPDQFEVQLVSRDPEFQATATPT